MTGYIEREAFLDAIERGKKYQQDADDIAEMLQNFSAADVRPVVRAKWKDDWETGCSECSACGESYLWEDYDGVGEWNFCPNCGADMREGS